MLHPTIAAFLLFVGLLLVESWFSARFLRKLRRDYPKLWKKCGQRTVWTDKELWGAWPTIKLLWERRYEKFSSDRDELKFFEDYRAPVVFSYAGAVTGVVLFLASFLIFGWPESGNSN